MLIAAIEAAGGPLYEYRRIDRVDDADGGQPGGNVRVGFLRTDRGLSFIDRRGDDSTTATTIVDRAPGPQLSFSPGRIQPATRASPTRVSRSPASSAPAARSCSSS
jgi:hypothetical protein